MFREFPSIVSSGGVIIPESCDPDPIPDPDWFDHTKLTDDQQFVVRLLEAALREIRLLAAVNLIETANAVATAKISEFNSVLVMLDGHDLELTLRVSGGSYVRNFNILNPSFSSSVLADEIRGLMNWEGKRD